jgi:hypothetical protein
MYAVEREASAVQDDGKARATLTTGPAPAAAASDSEETAATATVATDNEVAFADLLPMMTLCFLVAVICALDRYEH